MILVKRCFIVNELNTIPYQQDPQHPPPDFDFENMERVDSSGFGFSNEISRLTGVLGGVSPTQ